ncbi:hypothetical protein ACH3O9_04315 [Leeuwenhoekiella sp. A16]|uniref:hypothetical protein n=1 Tax=unclassified Leeuwenhoekiella TaxID=2615029 RepID=UPI003A812D16
MLVIINRALIAKGYAGFAVWPLVVLRSKSLKSDVVFMNHERIHLRQQLELLVIPFFIWYAAEFLIRLAQYRNAYLAYLNVSFEREAYAKETSLSYLKIRKNWSFFRYL